MRNPDIDYAAQAIELSPLARKLGLRCRHLEIDRAEYQLDFDQSNTTIGELVHGGALLALADCAATGAAWSRVEDPENYRGITVDLSLAFMGPARSADVVATATVDRRGASLCFCTVDIRTVEDRPVARGKVVYKLERRRTPAETMAGLFEGRSTAEQMEVLAELERAGGGLYQAWAETAADDIQRRKLLDAAAREDANAELLSEIMSEHPLRGGH